MADRLLQQTQLRSRLCPEVEETNRVIGRGAYGVVVEMKLPDGTVVAGKKINNSFIESSGDLNNDRTMKEKFEQECMRLSQLHHENIVRFLGVHYKSSVLILLMECLSMSLTEYLEQYKMIPNHIKNSILLDVSLGLLYLHTQTPPIIHRDLKDSNVLLNSDMKAKIADLGESCIFEPEPAKHYMKITTCPGTPAFIPPEALQSKDGYTITIDNFAKLDVFSFGVLILYVYTQLWPKPYDIFNEHNVPRTEVQRRQHLLDKVDNVAIKQLAKDCLNNLPECRPHTNNLVIRIKGIINTT